jgi:hypothetical protein
MLQMVGIEPTKALNGFERWADTLEYVVSSVAKHSGQGGINMPEGQFLFGVVRALQPRTVIETGVAAGVSSCFFIAALLENQRGTLYSVDLPTHGNSRLDCADASRYSWPERGVAWAIPSEMKAQIGGRHHLILEDVREALPRLLNKVGQVDLFFHDDLHLPEHMLWEYQSVWQYLREGGVLASHDANMGWIRFCRDQGISGEQLANLNRLCAVRRT